MEDNDGGLKLGPTGTLKTVCLGLTEVRLGFGEGVGVILLYNKSREEGRRGWGRYYYIIKLRERGEGGEEGQ